MDAWTFVQSLDNEDIGRVINENPDWITRDMDSLKRALASRLTELFDWPNTAPVSFKPLDGALSLSGTLCSAISGVIADFVHEGDKANIALEPGDEQRMREVFASKNVKFDSQEVLNYKILAWVGSRWRRRFVPEVEELAPYTAVMFALADAFYPKPATLRTGLAVAGVVGTLGLIGAGVALYRSRRPKAARRSRRK